MLLLLLLLLFVDETTETEAEPVVESEAPAAVTEQVETPDFVQPKKPKTFIEQLMDDPSMLAAIGGGLLGMLALIGVLLRRRRVNKADVGEDDEWLTEGLDGTASDIDATVQTKAVDLEATGGMDLDATVETADSDDAVIDFDDTHIEAPDDDLEQTVISLDDDPAVAEEEEQDDVLAEADVYLAYGIY